MARIDPRVLDDLAATYQQGVSDIQIAAELAAIDAWFSFDSFDGSREAAWDSIFWPLILSSGTATAELTRAYLETQSAYVGVMLPLPQVDIEGWLAEDYKSWSTSPLIRARWLISLGENVDDAFNDAAERASKLVSNSIRQAEQETFRQMVDSIEWELSWEYDDERPDAPIFPGSEPELYAAIATEEAEGRPLSPSKTQFKRITQAGACGFCRVVADKLYSPKAQQNRPTGSWHGYCRCTWRRVTPTEAQRFAPRYDESRWKSVIKERFETGDSE